MVSLGTAQQASKRQPPVVIRSTTRLVQVTIVAKDKKGKFVTDLTKDDFIVEDNGKPQDVRFFNFHAAGKAPAPAAVEPGVFSNRYAERARLSGGVTVIVLDSLNTAWGDQAVVRQHVMKFLTQIQPEDRIALYALGRQIKVLHDYTDEPKALAKALELYLGRPSPELGASFQPSIEEMTVMAESSASTAEEAKEAVETIQGIINTLKEEEFFFQGQRVLSTMNAFETIANHLAGVPGRKNLIWVSGSFPLQLGYFERPDNDRGQSPEISGSPNSARFPGSRNRRGPEPAPLMVKHGRSRTFEDEFTRMVRALNTANLSVYPVDARGLSPNPQVRQNIATMSALASNTGGKAYYNNNDIMNSIREAVEDTSVTYTLAYYPSEQKLDGRYRNIRVKVKRSDIVVRHRRGYLDSSETPAAGDTDDAVVQDALWSPLDATGVALDARAAPASVQGSFSISVRVYPGSLTLEPREGRHQGKVEVYLMQTDEQGNSYGESQQTISMDLLPATHERLLREGYTYTTAVERQAKATTLRLVVRDVPSGKLGRVVIPFGEITR